MEIIKNLCSLYESELLEKDDKDSEQFNEQSKKCNEIFEDIIGSLNENQKEKLLSLDYEFFILGGISRDEGFKDGFEKGFKLSMRLFTECLQD